MYECKSQKDVRIPVLAQLQVGAAGAGDPAGRVSNPRSIDV